MSIEEYNAKIEANHKWNFFWLALDNMVFFFIFMGLSPYTILPFYLGKFTESKVLIGLIPTVYLVGSTLPQIFMARFLKNRRNRKKYLVITASIQRLGIFGMFLLSLLQPKLEISATPFLILFFMMYALQNVAGGYYYPAWADFLGKAITRQRGFLIGISNFLGGLLGLGLGWLLSYLLDRYPFQRAIPVIFGISFAASMVSLTAILSWREVVPPEAYFKDADETKGSYSKVFTDRNFVSYLVWRGLMVILEIATPYYTLSALEQLALNAGQVGVFTTIMSFSEAVLNPLWGWLGDRRGFLNVVKASALAGICGAFLAIFFPTLFTYYAVFFLIGAMICGFQISSINVVYEFSPHQLVPLYTAISMIALTPLSSIVPTLGGFIAERMGYVTDFWIAGALGLVSLIGFSIRVKNPKKKTNGGLSPLSQTE
jgi:MFS family permease